MSQPFRAEKVLSDHLFQYLNCFIRKKKKNTENQGRIVALLPRLQQKWWGVAQKLYLFACICWLIYLILLSNFLSFQVSLIDNIFICLLALQLILSNSIPPAYWEVKGKPVKLGKKKTREERRTRKKRFIREVGEI